MPDHETIAFHDDSFRLYLLAWREPDYRGELEMGLPEAAYHALAHAGMLERIGTPESRTAMGQLLALSREDRTRLLRDACEFAAEFAVPKHFERFFAQEAFDVDDLAEVEAALIQRDELDVVMRAVDRLIDDVLVQNDDLRAMIARAHGAEAVFDERLSERPDLLAVASRIVADSTDPTQYGSWLLHARQSDEEYFEPTLRELLKPAEESGNHELGELLVRRNEEISAADSSYALAASARDAKGGAEDELLKTSWEIAGDPRVPVRFQLDEAGSRRQLKLVLDGPFEPWQEYTSAQVVFRDGPLHTSSFALGVATFEVESTEIRTPLRAAVVNRRGDRRFIVSPEDRNGGRKT